MKIAVVGAGISGLSAALLLGARNEVTLFEANDRLGGHSNTIDVAGDAGESVPVDTGFIVYNVAAYPNLIGMFSHLDVETVPTEMSFSVSLADGAFEYTGNGLPGLFAQRRNALSPTHWRMIIDIVRFFRHAAQLDPSAIDPAETLRTFLARHNYGSAFMMRHVAPMGAAIWSTPAEQILEFPAAAFIRFFANHGLLQLADRPQWRTVVGGSRAYVTRIRERFPGRVVVGDPVIEVRRTPSGVRLATARGNGPLAFDACVIACHADQALAILADPSEDEARLLGAFSYARNEAVLHADSRLMPRRPRAWTSWNYLGETLKETSPLCVTYWMNRLQPLALRKNVFVTLNPWRAIDPTCILSRMSYTHPIFDLSAMKAQRDLWSLQGVRATWFAGSYFGYGFHEDGVQSGVAVAEDLGGLSRPWAVPENRARDRILSPLARQPGRPLGPRLAAAS
ncbi:MAG: FAD-dependent oxidoreductase [Hyphomicrobiaceae bacterium]|nr:FAD-dependent oxidoreductase [Hyphomicrobiaceae bacterium]